MWFGLSSIKPIHANLQILPSYPYQFCLPRHRMTRTKLTPRKSTGPKGVPRRQLAPRDKGASSSRPDPQAEMERLSGEIA
jgi:hypothetical protein